MESTPPINGKNRLRLFQNKEAAQAALPLKQPKLITYKDRRFMIVRTEKGIFVTENACPHNGENLSKGTLNYLDEIICPWHNYRFNLITGQESSTRCPDLKTYRVVEESGVVYLIL